MRLAGEIWSLLDRRQHRRMLGMLLLCIVAAFFTAASIAAVVPFLGFLADPQQFEGQAVILRVQEFLGIARADMLLLLGFGFFGAVLLSNAINMLQIVAAEKFTQSMAADLQLRLFDTYLRLDGGFHASAHGASLAANILQEVPRLTTGIIFSGLMLMTQAIASALIVCFVVLVNPVIASFAVVALGTAYLFIYLVVRRRLASHGQDFTRAWHGRARLVNDALGAVKEIILMRNQPFFTGRFTAQSRRIARAQVGIAAISQSPKLVLECVTVACLVGAALWLSGTPGAGNWMVQLSIFGMAAYRLLPSLQQSFLSAARIRANRAAFEKIAHDLRRSRLDSPRSDTTDPAWRQRPRHSIALHDVTVRYAPDRPAALAHLSLEIEAGSWVALVGPNGSGKSTLADVILGLLRPKEGWVEVDGITLADSNLASWQSAVAYVPQSIFLLDATLAENIALGSARSDIDERRLRDAIELANLREFVATLPRGLEEPLGEKGVNLSGGQRQRVGIARALYRQPSLLVLDEATSALDTEAEHALADVLSKLRGQCTIVMIAHRFSGLQRCDRVFELERGALVGSGALAEDVESRRNRAIV